MRNTFRYILLVVLLSVFSMSVSAQTEVMAWGNLTGIRLDGELIEFETSVRVVENGWSWISSTGKERNPTRFSRNANVAKVNSSILRIPFEQTVEDTGRGAATVSLSFQSDTTRRVEGVFYCFTLPAERYPAATVRIGNTSVPVSTLTRDNRQSRIASGRQIIISDAGREISINFSSNTRAFVRHESGDAVLYIQLFDNNLTKGASGNLNFNLLVKGDIDNNPVEVFVDSNRPGRLFEGMGGNFRLQNLNTDPQVIDYCLENMRVASGRVEMPWAAWDPDENSDPLEEARAGNINDRVHRSMLMAQRLAAMGMPVIVGVWFPPNWALAEGQRRGRSGGVAALRLDDSKKERIYKSLADYLVFLKEEYGVETQSFSFNESDIGIDILHTAQEHADFIKEFGAYMATRQLATRMLLGDNSDATTFDFIVPALNDPETHKYIAAVSFHSWRGCDDATLKKWLGAAQQLNVPLIIGEGSTDAAAWRYPQIFLEPTFALYEINLYVRICAISQPLSILQWQLTADYSLLWGAGIAGSDGPLRPTQRFWNIQQLADTPEQSFHLPVTASAKNVNSAAFGNISRNQYAVHLVNNGAERTAIIHGLPENCTIVAAYGTNYTLSRQKLATTIEDDGSIRVEMPPASFVSVFISTPLPSPGVAVNQVGYYPDAPKQAVIVNMPAVNHFSVVSQTGETVFSGQLSSIRQSNNSSVQTRIADFSEFRGTGRFRIIAGDLESHIFTISQNVHYEPARALLKGYYFQRVSMPLDKRFAGKWARQAGHPDNQVIVHPSAATEHRPAGTIISSPGGWYDAGDYNKYIVNSGITMATLLSSYEDFPEYFEKLSVNIPESGNGAPDILNEILYNLRWMLTMQDPHDGGVYNKLTNANFDGIVMPGVTKAPRYVVQKGTAAALNFVAVTAQAARIYKKYPNVFPGLSDSCLNAAKKAWTWALQHPDMPYNQNEMNQLFEPQITTGGYGDRRFTDEWFWAATEMYATTADIQYAEIITNNFPQQYSIPAWNNTYMLGIYTLLRSGADNLMSQDANNRLLVMADRFVESIDNNAFAVVMGQNVRDFIWGSNSVAANQGILLIRAYKMTQDKKYLNAAITNVNYLLGLNATGYCFVTGFGSVRVMHPHHRPSEADGITDPVPGLLAGGPNPGMQDGCDYKYTEPETAFVDHWCSYASNEIAINWNAPAVYLLNAIEFFTLNRP